MRGEGGCVSTPQPSTWRQNLNASNPYNAGPLSTKSTFLLEVYNIYQLHADMCLFDEEVDIVILIWSSETNRKFSRVSKISSPLLLSPLA